MKELLSVAEKQNGEIFSKESDRGNSRCFFKRFYQRKEREMKTTIRLSLMAAILSISVFCLSGMVLGGDATYEKATHRIPGSPLKVMVNIICFILTIFLSEKI